MRNLPPLAAVRAFEAAARHQNFTNAAAELAMTQAAISYQIKVLEDRVGTPLFRREKRRVVLTEAGQRVAHQLSGAFDAIDAAFAQLRAEDESLLTVSTSQTFAGAWLAWRIGGFHLLHPDIAVKFHVSEGLADFARDAVDLAIRSGRGGWPGVAVDHLMPVDYTPMCSPAFLEGLGGSVTAHQLPDLPLISPQDEWWTHWLHEAGVDAPDRPIRRGVRMDSQANEGNAAMAGQGFALLTPFFWRNDMAEGRLVQPFAQLSSNGDAYWLVIPEHRRQAAKIRRFRDWLIAEVAKDRAAAIAPSVRPE